MARKIIETIWLEKERIGIMVGSKMRPTLEEQVIAILTR
jgi:hypothetical protein